MALLQEIREAIADVLHPSHFFVAPPLQLTWEHLPADDTPWEIHRGQLVPSHLARETRKFETWNVFLFQDGQRSGEPLLSLKLDTERGQIHVVRGLLCWTWEGYHAGDNVYLSREVQRWVRELVGTLELDDQTQDIRDELAKWVFGAVVGLSRL